MQRLRNRKTTYVAPEVFHLEEAVKAVKAALDPTRQKMPPSIAVDEQMETEEATEEANQ